MRKLRHGATHMNPAQGMSQEGKPRQHLTPNLPSSKGPVEDEGGMIESLPPESELEDDSLWKTLLAQGPGGGRRGGAGEWEGGPVSVRPVCLGITSAPGVQM